MNRIVSITSRSIVAPTAPMRRTSVSCSALKRHGALAGRGEVNVGHLEQTLLVGAQEHALDGADHDRDGDSPLHIESLHTCSLDAR